MKRHWQTKLDLSQLNQVSRSYIHLRGVYLIHSTTTNEIYIGSTVDLQLRKQFCLSFLRGNKRRSTHRNVNRNLQRLFDDYGEGDLTFYVLEVVPPSRGSIPFSKQTTEYLRKIDKQLRLRERSWIERLRPELNFVHSPQWSRCWRRNDSVELLFDRYQKGEEGSPFGVVQPHQAQGCLIHRLS